MDNTSYRGLAFLLSFGTLPIACKIEIGGSASDGTTSGPTTDDPTGSDTTGASTGASDGMTTGGTGGATGTTTTQPTGGSASDTETGGPLSPCESYVAKAVMCEPELDPADELAQCQADRMSIEAINGPACAALYDALIECQAGLECMGMGCEAETDALYNCSPEIGPVCMAYAMKYAECFMGDVAMEAKYCQTNINSSAFMFGPECGTAYEEYFVCMTGLDCAAIEMGMGCEDKAMAIEAACA
jgi:hypothetical protein